jgi:hypothetical protein
MTQESEEHEDKNKKTISNIKFISLIVIFSIIFFILLNRKDKLSADLYKIIIRSLFVYLIKSILTKYLLDDDNIELFSKKNIITILISVITMALFLLLDESDIII